ncbi:MAG: TetR/AcrR family transcriptional regulator [Lewinellaceae bacterium]|nr:TetR/AcrR family transcriptional regulator [Saprospiraceae bacterium]MCB9336882.1 TetR/AcrR family transcriptional regulator [Lewinellaceae bacterium]
MPRTKQFDEQEVLQKAMDLFWKKGFHDTSMQELVDHLGINRASLYDTFGGKDALFEKTFEQYRQMNTKAAETLLASEPSVKEGFKKLFIASLEATVKDKEKKGCFVVNTTTELIPNEEKWMPILDRNRKTFEALFLKHLQRGVAQGEISPDKDLKSIAAMLFALNNGIGVVAKINPSKKDLMKIAEAGLRVLD